MINRPTVVPVADHSVLVVFAEEFNTVALSRIHALDAAIAMNPPKGLTEVVPALVNLLVRFDPFATDHAAITAGVLALLDVPPTEVSGRHHTIEVCYDAPHAPDLAVVAQRTGLPLDAVIEQHLEGAYRVGMYGFAPGFAYLYGTPAAIGLPRNPTPGPSVPAGSVIIAAQQCIVTPTDMSTGWFAIGRSSAEMLLRHEERPFRFDVGDTVSFSRINAARLDDQFAQRATDTR